MKLFLFLSAAATMFAGPITYTYTGSVTGTLGVTGFTNAAFTATAIGDTTNVAPDGGGGFYINFDTGTISVSIAGVGSGTFTDPMTVFACPPCSGAIELQGQSLGTGAFDFTDPALTAYTLDTAIGPVNSANPVPGFFLPWSNTTSFGTFNIISVTGPTFQATLSGASIPEPGTFVLVAAALLAAFAFKKRFASYLG